MRYFLLFLSICFLGLTGCFSNPIVGNKEPIEAAQYCAEQYPAPEFVEDAHLYTTLSITEIAKYDDLRKITISYYSQYPDIDLDYEAVSVSFKYLLVPWEWRWRNDITGSLHSLHGGTRNKIDQRRKNIKNSLSTTLKDPQLDWLTGLIIHAYGDSFSHTKNEFNSEEEKAYNVWIGHAIPSIFGNSPDDIKQKGNEPKYLGYIDNLYDTLKTNDENYNEYAKFRDFVDNMECNKGKCSDFHALFTNNPENGRRIVQFTDCMNNEARPLLETEVQQAMDLISGNGID